MRKVIKLNFFDLLALSNNKNNNNNASGEYRIEKDIFNFDILILILYLILIIIKQYYLVIKYLEKHGDKIDALSYRALVVTAWARKA